MNNSTEIRPNFKDGILRTFVSSKETTQIMKRIHTIITDFAAILGLKTQKNAAINCSNSRKILSKHDDH
jgi:hypothetical protein